MKNSALKKIIISLVLVLAICTLSLGLLSACNVQKKYHAEFYDRLDKYLNEDYAYNNFKYDVEEEGIKVHPLEQTFVVQSQEEFEEMFNDFPVEINFDKQILLVHVVTTITNGYNRKLKSIKYKNGELTIKVGLYNLGSISKLATLVDMETVQFEAMPVPMASVPIQRTIAVVMDKVKLTHVKFEGRTDAWVGAKVYNGVDV